MSKKIKVLLIIGAIITSLPSFSQVNASENAYITNISIEPTAHDNSADFSTSTKTTASDVAEKNHPLGFELLTEVRAAYYYFTDARTRDIYSGGGLYNIEASAQAWKQFYPWMSVGYLYASGSSIGEGDKTTLHVVPINLGVKYIFSLNRMNPYLGLGLVVAWAHTHDNSRFVDRKRSHWGPGGIAKAGILHYFTESFFIDVFLDYTYLKINFDSSNNRNLLKNRADLSGLSVGGGLGWRF